MLGSKELRRSSLSLLDVARFFALVGVGGHSTGARGECWPWRGSRQKKGYGTFALDGRTVLAHRVSYAYFFGITPANLTIRHSCDNPCCQQPGHLLAGTNADNVADRVARNRGGSTLSSTDVLAIRRMLAQGEYQRVIAERFGVRQTTISNIALGKTWAHLDSHGEWQDQPVINQQED
jgi:hypothetical protein